MCTVEKNQDIEKDVQNIKKVADKAVYQFRDKEMNNKSKNGKWTFRFGKEGEGSCSKREASPNRWTTWLRHSVNAEGDCILKLSREELYQRFNKLVESVNVLLETFREEALYTGPLDDELATAICNCDPNGP